MQYKVLNIIFNPYITAFLPSTPPSTGANAFETLNFEFALAILACRY